MSRPWRELVFELRELPEVREMGVALLADEQHWRAHVVICEEMDDWRCVDHVADTYDAAMAWLVTWLWERQQPLTARSSAL